MATVGRLFCTAVVCGIFVFVGIASIGAIRMNDGIFEQACGAIWLFWSGWAIEPFFHAIWKPWSAKP